MMKINLPAFLILVFGAATFCTCRGRQTTSGEKAQMPAAPAVPADFYAEKHRPQFHFSPAQKWCNDPNGMVFFDGEYHLFYQHFPDSSVWGPMHWGHAVSKDLVKWEHLPIAIYPDSLGYIFSGSAVVDEQNTTGFGENGKPPLVAMYTIHNVEKEKAKRQDVESQGIAYSNDRGRTWKKYAGNPVLPNPGTGKDRRDFRDPKVLWHEASKQWVVVLAVGHHAEFWGSKDLKKWAFLSGFGQKQGTHAGVWECPDLFQLNDKWVLLINLNPGGPNGGSATQYFVGDFDGKTFRLDPVFAPSVSQEKGVFMDFGKDNYASVSWSDVPKSDGRRLIIGWMSNWQYANKVPTTAWRNAMTLPRELILKKTETSYLLVSKPVRELESLRGKTADLAAAEIAGMMDLTPKLGFSPTLSALELEFELPEKPVGTFGIELSNSKNEKYRIGFDASKNQFFSDRTKSGDAAFSTDFAVKPSIAPRFSKDKTVRLHLFFDKSSAELFADDGSTVMTELFFPSEDFGKISLFSEGGKVQLTSGKVWEMKGIWR